MRDIAREHTRNRGGAAVSSTTMKPLAATLPALIAALTPKCPLCLLAITSALGIELPIARWLRVAIGIVAVITIAFAQRCRMRRWPVVVAVVAVAIGQPLLLVASAIAAAWPARHPSCTVSMETEPPSIPSTGNVTASCGVRAPRT
jgi:NAD/NADP transhydrogenase beta subunit